VTTDPKKEIEEIAYTRLLRLNAVFQGIVAGIVVGLVVFGATLWLVIKGGPVVGPHLGLLAHFYIGYGVTVGGSFVGLAYGFATGFAAGYVVARLYNVFVNLRDDRG
jgi:hypothetical protein